jgi:hypothetical protein
LAGFFGENNFNYISSELKMCTNSSDSKVVCKSNEEINNALRGGFFVMNYIDTIFEPINFSAPNKYIRRDFYTTMSNNYYKEINFFFKNMDYMTDKATILEEFETNKYLQLDRQTENYDFREISGDEAFLSCLLRLSNMKDIYTRKYTKLQDVIAQVGGLVKGLFVIVKILYFNFSQVDYFFNLGDYLYFLEDPEVPIKKDITDNIINLNISHKKHNQSSSLNHPNICLMELNSIEPKIKKALIKFQNKMSKTKFLHKLWISISFYCLSLKTAGKAGLYYRISRIIKQQSDIRVILK